MLQRTRKHETVDTGLELGSDVERHPVGARARDAFSDELHLTAHLEAVGEPSRVAETRRRRVPLERRTGADRAEGLTFVRTRDVTGVQRVDAESDGATEKR